MKLLWFSHFIPYPPRGGAFQRSFNLIRQVARTHEVSLVAFNLGNASPQQLAESAAEFRKYCARVDFWELPLRWKGPRWWLESAFSPLYRAPFACRSFWSRDAEARLRAVLDEARPDLLHVDSSDLALFTPAIARYRKVLNHHNCESAMVERRAQNEPSPPKRAYLQLQAKKLRRVEADICHRFDVNTAVSEEDVRLLRQRDSRAHFHVVENGTDVEYFRPSAEEPQPFTLIFAGSLNWYPNLSGLRWFLDQAWADLRRELPQARLFIAGQNPVEWLSRRAQEDSRITVVANPADMRPLVHSAAGFICPIRDGGGTRLKILDAFAMGKAVITTAIGCEGIPVRDGEHLLIANDPREFARRTAQVLQDDGLRRRLGACGRALAEQRYSWRSIAADLEQAYACALGISPCGDVAIEPSAAALPR